MPEIRIVDINAVLNFLLTGGKSEKQILKACNLTGAAWRRVHKYLKSNDLIERVDSPIPRWKLKRK